MKETPKKIIKIGPFSTKIYKFRFFFAFSVFFFCLFFDRQRLFLMLNIPPIYGDVYLITTNCIAGSSVGAVGPRFWIRSLLFRSEMTAGTRKTWEYDRWTYLQWYYVTIVDISQSYQQKTCITQKNSNFGLVFELRNLQARNCNRWPHRRPRCAVLTLNMHDTTYIVVFKHNVANSVQNFHRRPVISVAYRFWTEIPISVQFSGRRNTDRTLSNLTERNMVKIDAKCSI